MANVGQLMTKEISVIAEGTSIQEAATRMQTERIGSLLVGQADDFIGIITETDVVRVVAEQPEAISRLTVKGVMSSPIITIDRKLSPHYARDLMADRKIRHLGVTDDGNIVGVISVRDLLAYFKTVSQDIEGNEE